MRGCQQHVSGASATCPPESESERNLNPKGKGDRDARERGSVYNDARKETAMNIAMILTESSVVIVKDGKRIADTKTKKPIEYATRILREVEKQETKK